ncbi:DNA helicase [Helicobacter monodelphidis]|uniref:cory-CC-star protein n=1 Tax=Helicobacter sp. 15-1451 TaxID=2004995 RepID=UPI000DCF3ABC|nr:cory-CC-star protein [Helicobacter sp. 15-1451]RAX58385.1 DNA helicase [Helicobacter sp. 15-1451]
MVGIRWFASLSRGLENFYFSRYRPALIKEKREIDDFFMIITFSEMMGIPNPFMLYTLEMLPELAPRFHDWHKRMGLPHSPFDHFPCLNCC